MNPTKDTYNRLEKAYTYFNRVLFAEKLPFCIITLQHKNRIYGYFWADKWDKTIGDKRTTDEIALNPDSFAKRSLEQVLSTLVHEMCHLERHHSGKKASRGGYHDKQWARMMEAVGLIPTDTGKPGGKKTGRKVTHYIEPEGAFEKACSQLIKTGFTIPWQARTENGTLAALKRESKTKYTCPCCGLNAWGKPNINLKCGDCDLNLQSKKPFDEEDYILISAKLLS